MVTDPTTGGHLCYVVVGSTPLDKTKVTLPRVTKTVKETEARQHFSQLLGEVSRREARVLVEKSGIPVAAIVAAEDLDRLRHWEAQQQERLDLLGRMRSGFTGLSEEQISQDVAKVIDQVRHDTGNREAAARRP